MISLHIIHFNAIFHYHPTIIIILSFWGTPMDMEGMEGMERPKSRLPRLLVQAGLWLAPMLAGLATQLFNMRTMYGEGCHGCHGDCHGKQWTTIHKWVDISGFTIKYRDYMGLSWG